MTTQYFHPASGVHLTSGVAFTIARLIDFDVPAVMAPGEEEGTMVEVEPARVESRLVDVQYEKDWAQKLSPEEIAELGLAEVMDVDKPEGDAADDRYNWIHFELQGAQRIWTSEPKAPEMLEAARKAGVQSQIASLESQQLMPRATREFMLLFMESQFPPEVLAQNHGYKAVKEFDLQITALREQLA